MANDRVSQQPVEVVLSPTDVEARTTQAPVEAVLSPTSGKARTSQQTVEAVIQIIYPSRIAQLPVEAAVSPTDAEARLAQMAAEVTVSPTDADARLAQIVVETLLQNVTEVALGLIVATAAAFTPGVDAPITVTLDRIDQAAAAYEPSTSFGINLDLLDQSATTFGPTLTAGGVTVSFALLDQTAVAYEPTTSSTSSFTPALLDQTAVAHEPTVTPGVVSISLALLSQTAATYAPSVGLDQEILLERITRTADALAPVVGSQFLRPSSDVTNTGTGGFGSIDETTASDADFWYGDNNVAETLEVHLTDPADPQASTGHVIRYRVAKTNAGTLDGGGNAVTVTASLYQGTTLIVADSAKTVTGTWTTYSLTLSGAQADAITDYSDLRLRFVTSASGGSPANRRGGAVSWAEMEIPPVSSQALLLGLIDQTAAGFAPTATLLSQFVSLDLIDQSAAPFSPSLTQVSHVVLGLIDGAAATFDPTVSATSAVLLSLIDGTATCSDPGVSTTSAVLLSLIDGTASAFAPVVVSEQAILLGLIDATSATFDPTIAAGDGGEARIAQLPVEAAISPTDVAARLAQFAVEALVQNVWEIHLGLISNTPTLFAPVTANPPQFITVGLIDQTATLTAPIVRARAMITLPLMDTAAVPHAPMLAYLQSMSLGFISQPATAHNISAGNYQTIAAGFIDRTAVPHAPMLIETSAGRDDFDRTVSGSWGVGTFGEWTERNVNTTKSVNGTHGTSVLSFYDDVPFPGGGEVPITFSMHWTFPPTLTSYLATPIGFDIMTSYEEYDGYINVYWTRNSDTDGRLWITWNAPGGADDFTDVILAGEGFPATATGSPTATLVAEINPGGLIKAKYWVDGDPDPGWQLTLSMAGYIDTLEGWHDFAVWTSGRAGTGEYLIDWVDVDVAPYIALARIDQTAAVFSPTLFYNQTVTIGLLENDYNIWGPMVGLDVAIDLGLIDQTATAYEPFIGDGEGIWLETIVRPTYAYEPVVGGTGQQVVNFAPIINFAVAYDIESVYGSGVITLARISNTAVASTPDVFRGGPKFSPALIRQTATCFRPFLSWENGDTVGFQPTTTLADAAPNVLTNPGYGQTVVTGDFASFLQGPFPANDSEMVELIEEFAGSTTNSTSISVTNLSRSGEAYTTLYLFVTYGTGATTISAPASGNPFAWSQVSHVSHATGGLYVFTKLVAPANTVPPDPTSFTFTVSPARSVSWLEYWTTASELVGTDSFASSTTTTAHTTDVTVEVADHELLMLASGNSTSNASQFASWPLRLNRTASSSVNSTGVFIADEPISPQTLTVRTSASTATLLWWAKLRRASYLTGGDYGYAGWLRLHLTETQALTFDTFGSAMEDTMLSIISTAGTTVPTTINDSFAPRTVSAGPDWGYGDIGKWWGPGGGTDYSVSGVGLIASGSGGKLQWVLVPPSLASGPLRYTSTWRWDRYGTTYGSTSDTVSYYVTDVDGLDYVQLTVGYYANPSPVFKLDLEVYQDSTGTTTTDTYNLGAQAQLSTTYMSLDIDRERGVIEGRYWLSSTVRPTEPTVSVSIPGFSMISDTFEISVYHANAVASPSPWRFNDVWIEGERTRPGGIELYHNDDTSFYATSPENWWSSLPSAGNGGNLEPFLIGPGDYYIRVWPNDADAWNTADGDARLHINRSVVQVIYGFVDDADDAQSVVDPALGETFVIGDFADYTADPDDPTEIATSWNPNYSGWVKIVLTEPMYLALDTYGSGMLDTVIFVYYGETRPTGSAHYVYQNDDTNENPFYNHEIFNAQSAILDSNNVNTTFLWPAGTYWILVTPYDDAWLANLQPGETTTVQLRISRTVDIENLSPTRGDGDLPVTAPYRPPTIGYSDIVITYDGTDITDDVRLSSASFTYQVNGSPGTMSIEVKDPEHTYVFEAGKELTLDIDGERFWGGYVTQAALRYPLPVMDSVNPSTVARFWALAGVDYNILFQKRIVYDPADPAGHIDFHYAVGTYDDTIINDIFDNFLDLDDDGLSRSGVTRVAVVTVDIPGVTSGKGTLLKGKSSVANAGYTWKQAMDIISRATGAVYYIDPYKVLHYVDVDTPNADRILTDLPQTPVHLGLQSYRLLNDGTKLVNDMMVWGAATKPIVFAREEDAASIAEHGRWQQGLFTTGIMNQATADLVAESYVEGTPQSQRGGKDDAISVMARVFEPELHIGEKVSTYLNIYGFSDVLPIRRMTITFANPRQAIFDIILSHAIDAPWSIYERPPLDYNLPGFVWDPPKFPPPDCIAGLLVGPGGHVLDTFSRTILDNSGHVGEGNANPHWGTGELVTWTGFTFQVNTHYRVQSGYGVIPAQNAHYVMVFEYPDKLQYTTVPVNDSNGDFISLRELTFIIRLQPSERIINADMVSAVSENMPAWTNPTNAVDTTFAWNINEPLPDLSTRAVVGAAAIIGPAYIAMTFAPSEAAQITGTVLKGDPGDAGYFHAGGAWYGSDGAGFVDWTQRYANGTSFLPGEINLVSSTDSNEGIHYNGGLAIDAFFYTAVDERFGAAWTNKFRLQINGGGDSFIVIDRSEGGAGAASISTSSTNNGTSAIDSPMAKLIDPGLDYVVKWLRPSAAESYVKIWLAGDAEPPDGQWASFVSNASTTPSEVSSRYLSFGARSFHMQAYDFMVGAVVAGDAIVCPDPEDGPSDGDQEAPTDENFDGTTYQLPFAFYKGSTQVWVDGLRKRLGVDYTEQPTAGTITFTPPISPAANVYVIFSANGVPV